MQIEGHGSFLLNKSLKYIFGLFVLVISYHYVYNYLSGQELGLDIVLEDRIDMTFDNSKSSNNQFFNKEDRSNSDVFSSQLLKTSLMIMQKSTIDIDDKTEVYIKIADAYQQLDQLQNASFIIEYTVKLNQQDRNNIYLYWSWYNIAEYYLKYDDKQAAIKLSNQAFNLIKKISDYEERDNLLVRIGDQFAQAGEYIKTLECAELIQDDFDQVELYKYLTQEYIDNKQYQHVDLIIDKAKETGWEDWILEDVVKSYLAQEDFERSFEAIEMMNQEQAQVNALSDIAQKYWKTGDKSKAIENLAKAQGIADHIQNSNSKSWSLQAISRVQQQIDNSLESNSLLSDAVAEAQKIDDVFLQGFAVNNLAFQLASAGKYEQAIETIESSKPFIPSFQKIRLLIAISSQYLNENQPEKADQMINRAMKTVTEMTGNELAIPREEAQSFAWNDIADYALEHQQYDLVLIILKQIESLSGKVHLLCSISDKYIKNGEYKKARETLQQAIEVLSKVKDSKNLYMLPEIANLYAQMGDYYSALNTVKLIPTDIYQAQTLTAIALTYAKSPQEINSETFEVLESLI